MGHTNPLYGLISRQLIFDISRPVACRVLHFQLSFSLLAGSIVELVLTLII
jgi:hypothetical protein